MHQVLRGRLVPRALQAPQVTQALREPMVLMVGRGCQGFPAKTAKALSDPSVGGVLRALPALRATPEHKATLVRRAHRA